MHEALGSSPSLKLKEHYTDVLKKMPYVFLWASVENPLSTAERHVCVPSFLRATLVVMSLLCGQAM